MKYKNKYAKSDHPNDVIVNKWRHEDKLLFQSKEMAVFQWFFDLETSSACLLKYDF